VLLHGKYNNMAMFHRIPKTVHLSYTTIQRSPETVWQLYSLIYSSAIFFIAEFFPLHRTTLTFRTMYR